jgi:organic hydroperoxide reductase OsmC/OhrA
MADQVHQYETTVQWTDARRGTLSAPSRPAIVTGAPPEFGGSDDVWSPEHLCVAAVNSCVMLTFIAIATNSKVPFRAYAGAAVGTIEKVEGRGFVITRVVVKPRITIGPEVDRAKVERLIKMAEKNCLISNSLHAEITLEPEIVVE